MPVDGGVVLAPRAAWRACARSIPRCGESTSRPACRPPTLRRRARENGLYFPPDPGAAEQSQIGGNVATNAGGPHAFKYGVTGAWVTGLEAVLAPGEIVDAGGPIRKDVAGYDLRGLLVGSEGTLGIVTAAWLRLVPAPEAALPVAAFYASARGRLRRRARGSGAAAWRWRRWSSSTRARSKPPGAPTRAACLPERPSWCSRRPTARPPRPSACAAEVEEVLGEAALRVDAPPTPAAAAALWRWRDGVSIAVTGVARGQGERGHRRAGGPARGGDRRDASRSGARHGLPACSWGHAGDGNLHSTFMIAPGDEAELELAAQAADGLFDLAGRLGGSVSGEHGVGWVKRGQLAATTARPRAGAARCDQARLRPEGPAQPGQEERGLEPAAGGRRSAVGCVHAQRLLLRGAKNQHVKVTNRAGLQRLAHESAAAASRWSGGLVSERHAQQTYATSFEHERNGDKARAVRAETLRVDLAAGPEPISLHARPEVPPAA